MLRRTETRSFASLAAFAIATAISFAPAAALAGDRHDSRGGIGEDPRWDADQLEDRLEFHAERIADLLELTADQRTAFDRIRADAFAAARPKIEQMRQEGDDLRELLDAERPDAATVGAKVIEIHRLREDVRATKKSVESELVKLLTPEQKFAFDALKEARDDFGERGRERFAHRDHRGRSGD